MLAFDQIGFGSRVLSAGKFYDRFPRWSLLGNMICDTRAAITALQALDMIDPSRISLFGYALGAEVGLFTAALDDRVRAVVAAAGFSPLRLESAESGTEGIRHYSHLHGLIPRLGFFVGYEKRVPFDYDEVLAAIAPRSVLVIAPEFDRYAPLKTCGGQWTRPEFRTTCLEIAMGCCWKSPSTLTAFLKIHRSELSTGWRGTRSDENHRGSDRSIRQVRPGVGPAPAVRAARDSRINAEPTKPPGLQMESHRASSVLRDLQELGCRATGQL